MKESDLILTGFGKYVDPGEDQRACKKMLYMSSLACIREIRKAVKNNNPNHTVRNYYLCDKCNHYHLTSNKNYGFINWEDKKMLKKLKILK